MQHCWIYLRKSRALGDPDDPNLLAHHRAALLRLAEREGLTVPEENIIQEIGSAETIAARPRFAATLATWERLPADSGGVVLVTELERLSRGSLAERGRIVDALAEAGIQVLTLSRRYNLRDPDDATWFTIFSELGKRELDKFKSRLALRLAELLQKGRTRNGRAPYGWEWDPKRKDWVPHPDRFPIVQAWCEEIRTSSCRQIGDKWGVPFWIVHDTLTNPAICGWPAKRTRKHKGKRSWSTPCEPAPREEWLWPEQQGAYPVACTRERWHQIQQELAGRAETRAKVYANENAWCRDLVRFTAAPHAAVHLSCDTNFPPGHPHRATYTTRAAGSPRLYVARPVVHAAAEQALRCVFASPALVREAIAAYHELVEQAPPEAAPQRTVRELTEQRDRLHRRLVDLLRREIDEESPIQQRAVAALRRETESEIRQLEAHIQAAALTVPAAPELDALLPLLTHHLADLDTWWTRADDGIKRRIANAFIHEIGVRTEPVPGRKAWHREVECLRLAPWLEGHVLLWYSASGSPHLTVIAAPLRRYCRAA